MESHGRTQTIQITRNTYELIKDAFDCEPIGMINVKGAGEMEVWHVLGRKPVEQGRPALAAATSA
jgi:guanylate cyclase